MTQGPDDVLSVLYLAYAAGLTDPLPVDVAPLFETVDDLKASGDVLEALVDIEVDGSVTLWSNAEAIRTVPILGGSSWINITTVGGPEVVTRSPDPRNGREAVKLAFDGAFEGFELDRNFYMSTERLGG